MAPAGARKVGAAEQTLGSGDAARRDVLVRREPAGHLEPAREVKRAEVHGRGHLVEGGAGHQVVLDALGDELELLGAQAAGTPDPGP